MLKINDLTKFYGSREVLKNVNCNFERGRINAILGPNGSGKTTILKTILGMIRPTRGAIYYLDKSIINTWEYRNHVGYLPQVARFPENLTIKELLDMTRDIRSSDSNESYYIKKFGLQDMIETKIGKLSGGTQQKVSIVIAFMFNPDIIILDEPTVGLDPISQIRLKEVILEEVQKNKIILMTTHIISLVETLADKLFFLLEGHLYFQGSVEQLKKQTKTNTLEQSIENILSHV